MASTTGTRDMILEVAGRLFLTKGYEKTTISDIINGLDGLTKGAVYHYFDSKEEIFDEVVKQIGLQNKTLLDQIKYDGSLDASSKISKIISLSIGNETMDTITSISPKLLDSPKLLVSFFMQMQEVTIPEYFLPIIIEGVEDGSIKTDSPKELAELITILLNIWLNPLIFENSSVVVKKKLNLINKCLNDFDIKLTI